MQKNQIFVGLDEAGRGPVFGPLVVAAVWLTKEQERTLELAGVTDSKKLSPKKREELYTLISKTATHIATRIIIPQEINDKMKSGTNLTQIELQAFSNLLQRNLSSKAYLDCPSINKYAVSLQLKKDYTGELIVEHKADSKYIAVAAASIVAKVTRDKNIEQIQSEIPYPIGSGYPSDPATQRFIQEHHKEYPHLFRTEWKTYKDLLIKAQQKELGLEEYY